MKRDVDLQGDGCAGDRLDRDDWFQQDSKIHRPDYCWCREVREMSRRQKVEVDLERR